MRKTGLVILLFLTMFGVSGCASKSYTIRREIKTYLENKYHSKFYFVSDDSPEDNLYSADFTYRDEDGNKFYVKYYSGYSGTDIHDQYGYILFGDDVQEILQEAMGPDYVVHVTDARDLSGAPESYSSTLDYMQRCTWIEISIYTEDEPDYTQIAQTLIDVEGDICFDVLVHFTDDELGLSRCVGFEVDGNQIIEYSDSGLFE